MNRIFLWIACATLGASSLSAGDQWQTAFEKSGGLRTPRYQETIDYCKALAKAFPSVHYESFGVSPQGRDLPLLIVSKTKLFTPEDVRKSGKAVVLIQSGIHAGEIDGKDASLMLVRDMVITKKYEHLLDHVVVLFVPIFNVDGHERFGKYNRINQNGPEEMGWRVTAQNLNLNRDYMKADAPEMRGMLQLFTQWLPDFYVDCHVTDGIDCQYDVTYSMETYPNIDAEVARWIKTAFIPSMTGHMERSGHLLAPYIIPREDRDLTKGFVGSPATPRFSTGYAALQNRPALLIETHMMKPYKMRVEGTYEMLVAVLEAVNAEENELHSLLAAADKRAAGLSRQSTASRYLPLRFQTTDSSRPMLFKGIDVTYEHSDISGEDRRTYTGRPVDIAAKYFDQTKVTDSVIVPDAYLLPAEWTRIADLVRLHGINFTQLSKDSLIAVERYRLTQPKWQERPYEGRHPVTYKSERFLEKALFPAGTYVVPTSQRTARVIVNLLEPQGPDSFVAWGFFDAIFEQKEYGEDYVLEKLAQKMSAENPALRSEFDAKVAADSVFAKNAYGRLNFFYQHSPYWDAGYGMYPVARIVTPASQK